MIGERLFAELRKYGESLIAVSQSPYETSWSIARNARTIILHRMLSRDLEVLGLRREVEEVLHYGRGRPRKDGRRSVQSTTYRLRLRLDRDDEAIQRLKKEAGCFVLLANIPVDGAAKKSGKETLVLYKEQNGIERNFGFIKDPMILDELLVKKTERIEVLGMILLIALLIWNLIQRQLRRHIEQTGETLPGWVNRPTPRPTAFMFSVKFKYTGPERREKSGKRGTDGCKERKA